MKKFILLFAIALAIPSFSQDVKKINKAIKVFDKDFHKGIDKMRALMAKTDYPTITAYEVLVKMEHYKYERSVEIWETLSITTTDDDGNEISDTSAKKLIDELLGYSEKYFVNVCRSASIESFSHTADMYLRKLIVEEKLDTGFSDEVWNFFNDGTEHFAEGKLELAELDFRKALDAQPNFYLANMYLGHSFWHRENYDSAMYFYEKSKMDHPTRVEPRDCIIDCLVKKGLYYRAKKECIELFFIYPGHDAKLKYNEVLEIENKWMNDHRFKRFLYPNDMKNEEQQSHTGRWGDYRSAKEKISKYCNEDGIIEPNGVTTEKYLEVYTFGIMLEMNADDLPEHYQFALKMMEEGYLDCYIFISMFHIDIYPQFKDYMTDEANRAKCAEYIDKYLLEKRD